MSLYKRGKVWWIRFTTPGGRLVRQSAETEDRQAARELHDRLKAASWRVSKLGDMPVRTWDEAALRWLQETEDKKSHHSDVFTVKWLKPHLTMKPLHEITRDVVAEIGELKRKETSPSRANRVLALIRAVLRRAEFDWDWLPKAPSIRMYREPKRRVRWLTPEELNVLLRQLPDHQRDAAIFAAATGLRQGNVSGLEWSQVNLAGKTAWIHADQAKGGRDIHVSLNETALAVLQQQVGKHPVWVFTYQGKPINRLYTKAWQKALKRAGIENFRWHDLRHTWASWLAQKGVPPNDIQEMGGWETPAMVQRYAHLSPAHLAHRARLLDGLIDTNLAQSPKSQVCKSLKNGGQGRN
ncbi:MAG TPA: site-specific integrase [Burkholderiales bacterium]|nr:site-specific integrase [Burkholderiales bacterium]